MDHAVQFVPHEEQDQPKTRAVRSALVSRNIVVNGRRTSVRLEPYIWKVLGDICEREHVNLNGFCSAVAGNRPINSSLASAIRVYIVAYYQAASTEDGHAQVGHGRGTFSA